MRCSNLILLGFTLVLWGCDPPSDDDDTAVGDDDDTTADTLSCAELGIPASYDEVATDYTELEAVAFTLGEEAIDLFSVGEIEALYGLFHESVQALLSLEDMQGFYDQIIGVAPLGERVDQRSMAAGQVMYYSATYPWQDLVLGFTFGFDADGAIMALSIGQMTDPLPAPHPDHDSPVLFQLPLPCLTYVVWGGRDELHNYHTYYAPNAYAYDFLVWQDGGTCAAPCASNEDYYIFGLPVLAPADGVVAEVENDRPDMPPGEADPAVPEGNHVTLEVAEGEYVIMGHMQQGSVLVEVGDPVTAGQEIGAVGNSGNTSEAHLHIHLQDQITYGPQGESMPMDFHDLLIDGEPFDRAMPVGGEFVAPAP
jgi:hypothetical protein